MRIRFSLFCLPALALLAACAKTDAPVRLDFVGATGLTSGNRTVSPGDTLITRAYGVGNDQSLQRLRIEVTYTPGPTPILYPVPTSSFDPADAPEALTITYLDSLLPASPPPSPGVASEMLFPNALMARTTSGQETWTYTVTDASQQTAARGYHLTVHKSDSATAYHSYPLVLRPLPYKAPRPNSVRDSRRVFLNLRYGLLLPRYAVLNKTNPGPGSHNSLQANQKYIDLVCVANQAGTTVSLVAPIDMDSRVSLVGDDWPLGNRRATELRVTSLTAEQFKNAVTTAAFAAAFNNSPAYQPAGGSANDKTTGPLANNQVVAFKVLADDRTPYYGLLQVTALSGGTNPAMTCQVKVQK